MLTGVETAELLTQQARQHGDDLLHQVHTCGPGLGLFVQCTALPAPKHAFCFNADRQLRIVQCTDARSCSAAVTAGRASQAGRHSIWLTLVLRRTGVWLPDEMGHVSNVHAHSEVAAGQLLNGQRVIQVPGCWRVYAEQPACAAEGNQERGHGQTAVIWQRLSEHVLQIISLTSSMVNKHKGGAMGCAHQTVQHGGYKKGVGQRDCDV